VLLAEVKFSTRVGHVPAISSINPLQSQDDPSRQPSTAFHTTARKLQSIQLESAKQSANGLDTLELSGLNQGQKLASDVSTLSRHLQTGDLGAAQTAYQAIRMDLKDARPQPSVKSTPKTEDISPTAHSAESIDVVA
jgi:hypothetical protein